MKDHPLGKCQDPNKEAQALCNKDFGPSVWTNKLGDDHHLTLCRQELDDFQDICRHTKWSLMIFGMGDPKNSTSETAQHSWLITHNCRFEVQTSTILYQPPPPHCMNLRLGFSHPIPSTPPFHLIPASKRKRLASHPTQVQCFGSSFSAASVASVVVFAP